MSTRRTSRRPKRTSRKLMRRTSRGLRANGKKLYPVKRPHGWVVYLDRDGKYPHPASRTYAAKLDAEAHIAAHMHPQWSRQALKRNGGLVDFTDGYISAALWSSSDDNDQPLDRRFSERDIDPHARHQMELDCARFFEEEESLWADGIDDSRAGRDFWLSRNGHGTGFFDEYDLPPVRRKALQDASKRFGEFDLYVGDDRKIHGSPLEQAPLEANVIPPPPVHHIGGSAQNIPVFDSWVKKTFAVGTPIRLLKPVESFGGATKAGVIGGELKTRVFPPGTVARVRKLYPIDRSVGIEMDIVGSPLLVTAEPERWWADVDFEVAHTTLQPLEDNWGPQTVPMKRPMKGRYTAPNKRTSRRVQPNATCPSCGSPHYFEGMWNRDCATPECRYFTGGTVGGASAAPSRPRPTGGRQILITFDTTTPESAAEGDYEESGERSTIDIEAEDLDEDETWAEYAANVIKTELGHVEDNGDGTYYQSEWHVTDYGTGEEERLAAHLHPPGAWAGDLGEIHELLKKWRLL